MVRVSGDEEPRVLACAACPNGELLVSPSQTPAEVRRTSTETLARVQIAPSGAENGLRRGVLVQTALGERWFPLPVTDPAGPEKTPLKSEHFDPLDQSCKKRQLPAGHERVFPAILTEPGGRQRVGAELRVSQNQARIVADDVWELSLDSCAPLCAEASEVLQTLRPSPALAGTLRTL